MNDNDDVFSTCALIAYMVAILVGVIIIFIATH